MAFLIFRRGFLFSILMLGLSFSMMMNPQITHGFEWKDLWLNDNQKAEDLFSKGEHQEAAEVFDHQEWKGISFYRSGEHEKALQAWKKDNSIRSLFNQGNSLAKLSRYEEAIESYDQDLEEKPDHSDAHGV